MNLDRRALKLRAKSVISTSRPSVITVGLVYLLLGIVFAYLSGGLMSMNISTSEAENYMKFAMEGNIDGAVAYAQNMMPPAGAHLIDLLLNLVSTIVNAGFVIFLLNTIRNTQPCFGNLLDGFGFFWKIILLNFLVGLFVALLSLLFVVPGIIAIYKYRMALYILVDDPGKSAMQCLRESKAMMRGHKWELFKLDLSFFGWTLLASIPTVGYAVQVWSAPYIAMTNALYYEQLAYGNIGYQEPVYTY